MAQPPNPGYSEPDPPSNAEAAALLNAAWADPDWGLVLWLTMIIGSRRGEISALRWHHIDSERELVWLHRSNANRSWA
jgi:integrase